MKCFIQACAQLAVGKGHFIEKERLCFILNQTKIFYPHHGIFQFSCFNGLFEYMANKRLPVIKTVR